MPERALEMRQSYVFLFFFLLLEFDFYSAVKYCSRAEKYCILGSSLSLHLEKTLKEGNTYYKEIPWLTFPTPRRREDRQKDSAP